MHLHLQNTEGFYGQVYNKFPLRGNFTLLGTRPTFIYSGMPFSEGVRYSFTQMPVLLAFQTTIVPITSLD